MGKSKKPRKKYVQLSPSIGMSAESIAELREELVTTCLRVIELLPRGDATINDMLLVRELIGTVIVGVVSRGVVGKDDANYAAELMDNAALCVKNLIHRYKELGRIVCKGDELQTILDALYLAGEFVRDSLDMCAYTVCVERMVALDMLQDEAKEHLRTVDDIVADIKRQVAAKRMELGRRMRGQAAVRAAFTRKYGYAPRAGTVVISIKKKDMQATA